MTYVNHNDPVRGKEVSQRITVVQPEGRTLYDCGTPPDPPDDDPGWTPEEPDTNPGSLVDGASFILDIPAVIPALWGTGTDVLWPEGESLMIAGAMGLGKTTLAGLLIRAQLGIGDSTVLSLPVGVHGGRILYLAMDRPAQIARSLARQFIEADRAVLADRLVVWKGPPPADIAKNPGLLNAMAESARADIVYVDSIKDAAIGLSDDVVGAGYNRARQILLAAGRQLCELHHMTKRNPNGGPPISVADIYGSAWITNGTGSIIMLGGDPGDPIISFRHVRQPATELGPWTLLHDADDGTLSIHHEVDVIAMVKATGPDGLTAKSLAMAFQHEDKSPTAAQIEKARRKLDKLTDDGILTRVPGIKGRSASAWFLLENKSRGNHGK